MKFYLKEVKLDQGGYAGKGASYFGHGLPLYFYQSVETSKESPFWPIAENYLRANSRQEAKNKLIAKFGKNEKVTFFR